MSNPNRDAAQMQELSLFNRRARSAAFDAFEMSTISASAPLGNAQQAGDFSDKIRRVFDILFSVFMLIAVAPLMAAAAVAIKLDSEGPVFYRQTRVGLNGAHFRITKFRSMRQDAEKAGVAVWASTGDCRITPVGCLLRKFRIDELPQFLDVLRGDMSVVGPRPERPEFVEILQEAIPDYNLRHTVKPGITGLAQVRYSYGASIDDARVKHIYDTEYLKNRSLRLDGRIVVETVAVVLFGKGAR
jgi:lipopolysaccharide/colanic/teichoic acid biosynthesis glycosyltransferase